jgi:hypothetical protein
MVGCLRLIRGSVVYGGSTFHSEDSGLEENNHDSSKNPNEPGNQDDLAQYKESHGDERTCSAQGLEQEAYFLLDAAKEQDPAGKKVSQIGDWPIFKVHICDAHSKLGQVETNYLCRIWTWWTCCETYQGQKVVDSC